jgi:asparagine synthase (glutamine-hydrolysing)
MGAIVAIIGDPGDPELDRRLKLMLARSPYRGAPEHLVENGLAVGIQKIANDASLARTETHIVAFHGFVGNWSELDSTHDLEFRPGSTDAERMAVAFEVKGEAIVGDLRGEFASVIYRRYDRSLVTFRDAVGRRPLFHAMDRNGRPAIATEIRQVLVGSDIPPTLAEGAMVVHLAMGLKSETQTLYQDVSRLRAGAICRASVGLNTRIVESAPFWAPPPESEYRKVDTREIEKETRYHLMRAVKRSIPAAPENYGLALSGGVDSSAIWALINCDLKTAGIDPDRCTPYSLVNSSDRVSETPFILRNLEAFSHQGRILEIPEAPSPDSVYEIPRHPNGTVSADALLPQAVQSDRGRVLIDGVGGDEFFRGHLSYLFDLAISGHPITAASDALSYLRSGYLRSMLWSEALKPKLGQYKRRLGLARTAVRPEWIHPRWTAGFPDLVERFHPTVENHDQSILRRSQMANIHFYRSGSYSGVEDQPASFFGIESRSPIMDLDVVNHALSIHPRWLIQGGRTKNILRNAVDDIVPFQVNHCEFKFLGTDSVAREGTALANRVKFDSWTLVQEGLLNSTIVDNLVNAARLGEKLSSVKLLEFLTIEQFIREFTG